MLNVEIILQQSTIIPVMVINTLDGVEDLAALLNKHGLKVLEITLRTDIGLEAVARIKKAHPSILIGTGTNMTIDDLKRSRDVGADFMVSPGTTPALLDFAQQFALPLLPGVATISEVMNAMAYGFNHMKLFPAEAVGGVKLLKSIAGPLPTARFCPTGGINSVNAPTYLALENVTCVGGSWMLNQQLIDSQNWRELSQVLSELNSEIITKG